jgi:hypothetical protein
MTILEGKMGLFGKRQPAQIQLFALPANLRSDIRHVFETAPDDACRGLLQEADLLPALLALNERLPADETVSTLTRCAEYTVGDGYMVLTDRRLIFALQHRPGVAGLRNGPPQMVAIPLSDISQFVFDGGMAGARAANLPGGNISVALPGGGPYSQAVCERVSASVNQNGQFAL